MARMTLREKRLALGHLYRSFAGRMISGTLRALLLGAASAQYRRARSHKLAALCERFAK